MRVFVLGAPVAPAHSGSGPLYAYLWWWLGAAIVILALAVALGWVITGSLSGILIDTRGRYSLTQLQIVLWTVTIFSLIAGVFFGRLHYKVTDPLGFTIPSELWGVLGISLGSTVLAVAAKAVTDSTRGDQVAASLPRKYDRDEAAASAQLNDLGSPPRTAAVAKAIAAYNAAKTARSDLDAKATTAENTAKSSQETADIAAAETAEAADGKATAQLATTERVLRAELANAWKPRFSQIFMQEQGAYADQVVDVTKFQNFLLTLVLVVAYIVEVIHTAAHPATTVPASDVFKTLPGFSGTFLTLLAISHGAYLAGKAIPQQGVPQQNLATRLNLIHTN